MVAVNHGCSDFGAQENKVCPCFHCFPICLPWSDGTRCHDLSFLGFSSSAQSVQSLSRVRLFATPRTTARLPVLHRLPEPTQTHIQWINDAIPPSHPLLLMPSIFPSIRVFSNKSALRIRWPKYWSFSFNISPSNEHPGLSPLGWTGWISLQSKGLSRWMIHHIN